MIPEVVKGFFILAFIFVPLEQVFKLRPQKILRSSWFTDAIYYFLGYFVGRGAGFGISLILGASLIAELVDPNWQKQIATQPIGLQVIEIIIVADLGYYIAHRLLHTVPELWKFHAVHHSIEQMDWLATVRVHPFDQVFTKTFQMFPIYILGFSLESLGIYALFSAAIAFYIHANLRLKLGILKWIVASPEFHHWHHTKFPQVYNKNFSAQFPLLDLLFCTLYLPAGKMPKQYGIAETVPSGYVNQLFYPFQRRLRNAK